jgi:hypothetical protein
VTEKKNGTWSKPKVTTYAPQCRIVDGEDGRTYVASYSYGHIYIMRGDMKYHHESLSHDDDHPKREEFEELLALMESS